MKHNEKHYMLTVFILFITSILLGFTIFAFIICLLYFITTLEFNHGLWIWSISSFALYKWRKETKFFCKFWKGRLDGNEKIKTL